jgi:hypothetical protein
VTANPTNLSFLGIAKEATKGTGVVPTNYIPIKTSITPSDKVVYLPDEGLRGSMVDVYNEVQGPVYSEIGIEGDVFPDAISWWLDGFFGDLVESGASAPFTHNHATKNSGDGQPGSKSITDFYGLTGGTPARRFAGCQVGELSFKWTGDGMFSYSTKLTGYQSVQVAKPTPSFTAITPLPGWLPLLTIGGSSKLFMESGEINLKRNVNVIHAADGTQAPYQIFVGPVQVDGKCMFVHEDDTELTRYLTGTPAALVFNWTQGAAAALVQVQATMTKPQYTVADIVRGKDYVETSITFKPVANTTDVGASAGYGACKFVVQNATAAGVYG